MLVSPTINSVHGRIRAITITDPTPGEDFLITVPARRRWRFISLALRLITDVNTANRELILQFSNGTDLIYQISPDTTQPASQDHYYYYADIGVPEILSSFRHTQAAPSLILIPDYEIKSYLKEIQAGDDFSILTLAIEEWIDP